MKKIGVIGLGKMGFNLIQNIKDKGFEPIGYDITNINYNQLEKEGISTANSIEELIQNLTRPRNIIIIVTAGEATTLVFNKLISLLDEEDSIIDGGNAFYKDSILKYNIALEKNINFIDMGISGGPSGALNGCCLMVGGSYDCVKPLENLFEKISIKKGYLYTGEIGSGHFAKMVHNGIEYGMMQAIAEGYDVLENSQFKYDYEKISNLWNNGSVIRGWLIELMEDIFKVDPKLKKYTDIMQMSGEGLWMVEEALSQATPVPVIALSVMLRQLSQKNENFAGKIITALRNSFGGHEIPEK